MADQVVRTIYEATVTRAQSALKRLSQDTGRAADEADDLAQALEKAGNTKVSPDIDLEIKEAEAEVKRLTRTLEALDSRPTDVEIDADISKSEKTVATLRRRIEDLSSMDASPDVELDIQKAEKQITGYERRIERLSGLKAVTDVEADTGAAQSDLDQAESRLRALNGAKAEMVLAVDGDSIDDAFDGVGDAAAESGGSAGEKAGSALIEGFNSTPIVGAVVGVLGAAGIAGGAALWAGLQVERNEDIFGARTGLHEATARKYGTAAGRSYADAWGESVSDNLDASQFARANDLIFDTDTVERISDVNSMLLATTEIMGSDIPETAEAAGGLIRNGLAKDAEDAFDIIVTGYQEGADRSGDYLDTLREYSPLFKSLGLSGQEAGALMSQSLDAGARSSDLAADALKEFSIRAQDDSKATRQAFKDLGLDADEMGSKIASGGKDAKGGLDLVLDGLRDIEDPMERNRIGVSLFGTQWEDLGNGAQVLAFDLDNLGEAWVNTGDTAQDAMDRMSNNAATKLEEARRTIGQALTELGGGLAAAFSDDISGLADWVSTNRGTILEFLQSVGSGFFDLGDAVVEFGATSVEVLGTAAGALSEIVVGIGGAVKAFGLLTGDTDLQAFGDDLMDAGDGMQEFSDNSEATADTLRDDLGGAIDIARGKFNNFMDPAVAQAQVDDAIAGITARLDEFVAYVDDNDIELSINGETQDAETAFNTLLTEISEGKGSVIINGETVPAEEALDVYMQQIAEKEGVVTVTADPQPAIDAVNGALGFILEQGVTVPIDANTEPASAKAYGFKETVEGGPAPTMSIDASTYFAEGELRAFQAAVNDAGGTVTINGNPLNGKQALDYLEAEINKGSGTVTMNGKSIPARQALAELTAKISSSSGTVDIEGNNSGAKGETNEAVGYADSKNGTIDVDANTGSANSAINNAARTRTAIIRVVTQNAAAVANYLTGRAYGGIVDGLATGGTVGSGYGIVPGPRAPYGVDNVLWPLASGGQTLSQPLAGGEMVVNPVSTAAWAPFLQAINGGIMPGDFRTSGGSGTDTAAIASAVSAAISGWQPVVRLGNRDIAGVMVQGKQSARTYGGGR